MIAGVFLYGSQERGREFVEMNDGGLVKIDHAIVQIAGVFDLAQHRDRAF